MGFASVELVESLFTDVKSKGDWPQAGLHTQWPGSGRRGDPVFDRFYASQVAFETERLRSEEANARAYAALVDLVGECIVIAHSQAGAYGRFPFPMFLRSWMLRFGLCVLRNVGTSSLMGRRLARWRYAPG